MYALCVSVAVNTQGFVWKVFYALYINFHSFIHHSFTRTRLYRWLLINVFLVISAGCITGHTFMHLQMSQSVLLILFISVFIDISVSWLCIYVFIDIEIQLLQTRQKMYLSIQGKYISIRLK